MTKVINCDDGYVVRGKTDAELLANAHRHIEEAHPDLVGKITDEQLLAMAQEQEAVR
jgi:predicted small metal-binding protein